MPSWLTFSNFFCVLAIVYTLFWTLMAASVFAVDSRVKITLKMDQLIYTCILYLGAYVCHVKGW